MSQINSPSATEIKVIFDRIAPVYDDLNNWLSLGQHHIWKLMAVKWSNPQTGDTALDICCGSGDLTMMLAKQVGREAKVIGLDFAVEQLAIARQKQAQKCPHLSISWVEGDALDLPFDNDYFDCATMGYGLRNVTDISLALQELHRVLKPNSQAAILDFHRPSQPYLRSFQQWYLANVVVPGAKKLNMTEEYAYISPSLDRFPTGDEQVKLAQQTGFTSAIHYPLAGGMMGVLVLRK
ncbi:MAG: bifunctional demethylmenaquinone methyltransferase/2-methoxy-6-polyprenyl-1,4-benzoquinol methylase UbiE [Xenococcaceae cyanobacterium]